MHVSLFLSKKRKGIQESLSEKLEELIWNYQEMVREIIN
jgi:hypothetical protein